MTLYASPTAILSHRTRIVLAEKGIGIDIVNVDGPDLPEDLLDINPYHSYVTLRREFREWPDLATRTEAMLRGQ